MTDWELLRRYVEHDDEHAFLRIVERHQDFVFACAKRQTGNAAAAEDVAQGVFLLLACKAGRISSGVVLTSWLFRATRFSALVAQRALRRRETHERESAMVRPDTAEPGWMQLAPHLDTAMDRLSEADRSALLLRYFQRQSLREVGDALGIGEEAARKRVDRATERLRETLLRSGVTLSVPVILALIAANRSEAAPAGFGGRIASVMRDPSAAGTRLADEAGRRWTARNILPWAAVCILLLLTTGGLVVKRRTPTNAGPPVAAIETGRASETSVDPALATVPVHHRMLVRVVDEADGHPLINGEVRYSFGNGTAIQTPDAQGETVVLFPDTEWASFVFNAWAPGYIAKYVHWRWSEWESLPPEHTVRVRKGMVARGLVVDEAGQPTPGVTVVPLWGSYGSASRDSEVVRENAHTAITDDAGRWQLLVVPSFSGNAEIHATHLDYATATLRLHPGLFPWKDDVRLVLSNGTSIKGVVVDQNNTPITGAMVEARTSPDFKRTISDRDGRFEIPHLPGKDRYGQMWFGVRADGYRPLERGVQFDKDGQNVVFTMQPPAESANSPLFGKVMHEDGAPIPANIFPTEWPNDPAKSAKSGYDGWFSFSNAVAGTREYTVTFSGHDPLRVRLSADGTEKKIVVPRPEALRIEGTLLDEVTGHPVPEFDVVLVQGNNPDRVDSYDSQLVASGRNGKFSLRCRPSSIEGKAPHLFFRAKGYRKEAVAIKTDSNPMRISLTLDPIRALKIKVLQPDGTPAAGARGGFSFSQKAPIDKTGEFAPIPSAPIPAVIYTANSEGILITPPPDPALLQLTMVHPSGYGKMLTKTRLKETLQLSPWASVKGVLNIGGKPAAGVLLGLTCSTLHYPYNAETATDSEGRFRFERVVDGEVTLARRYISREQYPGSNLRVFDVAVGEEVDLTVGESRVQVTGRLLPKSEGSRFEPAYDRITLRLPEQTDWSPRSFGVPISSGGSFAFDDVPAGEYTLRAIRLRGDYEAAELLFSQKVIVPGDLASFDLGDLPLHKPE